MDSELNENDLDHCYLGFVVLKPLPSTVVGRTCLATYDTDGGRRVYPSLRTYEANLYGLTLHVETLAFQEQDAAVAACATSAMWSAFQATGKLFQHAMPSPVEITKLATEGVPLNTRVLPTQGLTMLQMANAVKRLGLEPLVISPDDAHTLKTTIYAYIRAGIPVLMGLELIDQSVASGTPESHGLHAVAVTGYSLGAGQPEPYGPTGFRLNATRVDKLYAHDDQVGPFARMPFRTGEKPELDTSWRGSASGQIGDVYARATTLLVPLYSKIRIPFATIHDALPELEEAVQWLFKTAGEELLVAELEWDLRLTRLQPFKAELRKNPSLSEACRANLAERALPRFLWVAAATGKRGPLFTLLFDATDLEQGSWLVAFVERDAEVCTLLRALLEPKMVELMAQEGFSINTLRLLEEIRAMDASVGTVA